MDYKKLGKCFEGYFFTPWESLPEVQRQAWPSPIGWDDLTPSQRESLTKQHDMQHDPAQEGLNDYWFRYWVAIRDKEREIANVEAMSDQGVPSEAKIRREELSRLREELQKLKKEAPPKNDSLPVASVVGVPSAEIIEKFRLGSDWVEKLRKPDRYKYLLPALACRGKPGGDSSRWNPAKLGAILVEKKERNLLAVSTVISKHFTTWWDDWQDHQDLS